MNKINSTHILQTKLALQIFLQHLPEKNDTKRTIFTVTLKTRGFKSCIIYTVIPQKRNCTSKFVALIRDFLHLRLRIVADIQHHSIMRLSYRI